MGEEEELRHQKAGAEVQVEPVELKLGGGLTVEGSLNQEGKRSVAAAAVAVVVAMAGAVAAAAAFADSCWGWNEPGEVPAVVADFAEGRAVAPSPFRADIVAAADACGDCHSCKNMRHSII